MQDPTPIAVMYATKVVVNCYSLFVFQDLANLCRFEVDPHLNSFRRLDTKR